MRRCGIQLCCAALVLPSSSPLVSLSLGRSLSERVDICPESCDGGLSPARVREDKGEESDDKREYTDTQSGHNQTEWVWGVGNETSAQRSGPVECRERTQTILSVTKTHV